MDQSRRVMPLVENAAIRRLRENPAAAADLKGLLEEVVATDRLDLWRIEDGKKLLSLGRQAYYASRFQEAVDILLNQLSEVPEDPVIHAELGWALCALGKLDASRFHLDKALGMD